MPMNVALDPANKKLIEEYKSLGFSTRTAMINEALRLLIKARAMDMRAAKRRQMFIEYAASNPDSLLATIEGDDFEEPR